MIAYALRFSFLRLLIICFPICCMCMCFLSKIARHGVLVQVFIKCLGALSDDNKQVEEKSHFRSLRSIRGRLEASTFIMDSFSDSELMELSQKVKPLTWVIKVCHVIDGDAVEVYAAGFALKVDQCAMGISVKDDELLLMTCAHPLKKSNLGIKVRRLEDEDFILEAQILDMRPSWDIALLIVKGVNHYIHAEFVDDGSISNCQTLLHVGHSLDMVWSVFVGRAVYQCVNNFVPFSRRETCGSYVSSSLKTTPDYRIMGHIWNEAFFKKSESLKFTFEKHLHPSIPIIQCAGFSCREGCSGGPVFNTQGQIVGMIVGEFDGCQIAIHVSLLKEFIRVSSTTSQDSVEVDEKGKQPLGGGLVYEDALRRLKRKGPSK